VRNENDWSELWKKLQSTSPNTGPSLSDIDFDEYMVIAVFQGWQSSGGYSIEVTKIIEKRDAIEVFVTETSPGPHVAVPAVITHPYHIIKVQKVDKEVCFRVEHVVVD
jgi:hypothetical protein